jgi:hypothetical protein
MKKHRKTQHPPPKFLNASSPPLIEFIIFPQTFLNHPVSKRVLPRCTYSLTFGNELITHKMREVDAVHEIKIRVLHILY